MRPREFVPNGRAIVAVRLRDGTETVHDRPARITARRIVVDPVSRLTFDRATGAWLDSADVRIQLGKPRRVLCYQFDAGAWHAIAKPTKAEVR
jgi:hypothetical protein